MRSLFRVSLVVSLLLVMTPFALAADGLALTPPMGWNSWNKFACNVSEKLIQGAADALVASGMKDAGYQYVVIDDCWQVKRDAAGKIVADPEHFPSTTFPALALVARAYAVSDRSTSSNETRSACRARNSSLACSLVPCMRDTRTRATSSG